MKLTDKVAVVTGGGSGIGRAISLAYAAEGADVVVVDQNLEGADETVARIVAVGRRGVAIRTDISDPAQITAMVERAADAFGHVDILVNVAGIMTAAALLDTSLEQWDRTLNTNLRGTFLCLQGIGRIMKEQGHGKIINTTSILGTHARPKRGAYAASKAGIILLTQTAAVELGPDGIQVNAIAPGSIETPMVMTAAVSAEAQAKKAAAIPLRRRGEPEDLTGAAVFLASADSDYITGAILTIDGGMTAGIE
ncbi:3-oxoacyl-[acyl-carrier-protein] reductase [Microbacterium sp. cf046]|uniref:SDR family NAD(P)-dependent oxidoreductase n=1 Tax=Microbacterium sp. cf046 TaxID=1761803 RepID=UPI0008F2B762|nr:SDR family NAD(P)-dependent oxidoreductase [Microbacterium sp. cf046]SFS16741.1 3-oxoacyl-[acyl-carrier-protein] reductase [Microbacterium sp. cf046]